MDDRPQRAEVAVIGAGMAGLACAARLSAAGIGVSVWEKSRGLGGRSATRRRDGLAFDHGAPLAQPTEPGFAEAAEDWIAAGHAARWDAAEAGGLVGLPGMSALVAPLAEGIDVRFGRRVERLVRDGPGWRLGFDDESPAVLAERVAVAIPAPQAMALLGPSAAAFPGLDAVTMVPCWTVMAAYAAPLAAPAGWIAGGDGVLDAAIREGARPGRAADPERWVLHADRDWSAAEFGLHPEEAADRLLRAFAARLGAPVPETTRVMVQRWRYAQVRRPWGQACGWDRDLGLGLAGDWCQGPGLAAAWASGRALADRMLGGEG